MHYDKGNINHNKQINSVDDTKVANHLQTTFGWIES